MKKRSLPATFLILSLFASVLGQNPAATQQQRSQDDDDVVRITTSLIQVDAVVTDKNGKPVTDLSADEFEIQENGEKKKITNFSYVSLVASQARTESAPIDKAPVDKNAPPTPPVVLSPEQVQRTIALVVDDLGLSFDSMIYVRRALKKFVDQQMQPGDQVSIVRTSKSSRALQQFTSDKQILYAAIDRVRWNPLGRGGVSAFKPIEGDDISSETRAEAGGGSEDASASLDELSNEVFTIGTLDTIGNVLQGLREVRGRKSVMFFSDGLKIFNSDGQSDHVMDDLRRLTEYANRASVVIYTIDARGLPTLELTAMDNVRGMSTPVTSGAVSSGGRTRGRQGGAGIVSNRVNTALIQRRIDVFDSQQGINYLAEQTGGIAIRNTNDLSGGLKKMLDGEQGYYLIGYQPNEETFDPKKARFNKLTIKVKRSGVKVRYRSGFFGVKDDDTIPPAPVTRAEQMARAISAPFGTGGLDVRLTSLFANDPKTGSFMRSILHVNPDKLTFVDEPDGWRKLVFDIMAVTFGEGGTIVDEVSRTETVRVRGETHRIIMDNGFDYIITVPIKKPGAYQLRTSLRDSASEKIGTASQFIEVPDLNKNRVALSGIIVNGYDLEKLKAGAANSSGEKIQPEPQSLPGVRMFRRGLVLEFGYVIYNALLDKATGRPKLQTQIRVFRDGRQIFAGEVLPYDPGTQADLKRLAAGGRLQLSTDMVPGDYVLQVIVTDLLVKEKQRPASQWIDFQISDK